MRSKYLGPGSPARALEWMTASEQCLGWVWRDGVRRIRWVRIEPSPGAEILVSTYEGDLVGSLRTLKRLGVPELDPTVTMPSAFTVRGTAEAVLAAERETGARPDRWVNPAVEGWDLLCEIRGHS